MIEIVLGLLLVAGAFIILTGAGDTLGLSNIDFFRCSAMAAPGSSWLSAYC